MTWTPEREAAVRRRLEGPDDAGYRIDLAAALDELERVRKELERTTAIADAWRDLAWARGSLLTCYRLGDHARADRALSKIERARAVLAAYGVES